MNQVPRALTFKLSPSSAAYVKEDSYLPWISVLWSMPICRLFLHMNLIALNPGQCHAALNDQIAGVLLSVQSYYHSRHSRPKRSNLDQLYHVSGRKRMVFELR